MSTRSIDLSTLPLAYPPAIEWIKANELDPHRVPQRQEVVIEDGTLTLKLFVLDDDGHKAIGVNGPVVETATVELLSPPENHGL